MAYHHTYGLPVLITRAGNNGPYHIRKVLPLFITHALTDQPLPLYAMAAISREWLQWPIIAGLEKVLRQGKMGEIYNILEPAKGGRTSPRPDAAQALAKPKELIRYVPAGWARPAVMRCR